MIEIKFRAWCNKDKRYYYTDGEYIIYENRMCLNEETGITGLPSFNEPEQYTGLKDKNGNDIYRGDILLHGEDAYSIEQALVVWIDNEATFALRFESGELSTFIDISNLDCEVIGNVNEGTKE